MERIGIESALAGETQGSGEPARPSSQLVAVARPSFDSLYDEYFAFAWRSALRLGVERANVDDVVQELFFVVHKKLPEFEGRASPKTWLFSILLHVVRHYRRTRHRKDRPMSNLAGAHLEALADPKQPDPERCAGTVDALRRLDQLLQELDDDKREVFVLSQVEQMTAIEIAEVLGENLNTVYSRIRTARRDFELALQRQRAREARRRP